MTRRDRRPSRPPVDATARAVISCAADAIIAVGTDRRISVWNPAAERLFGWAASEVVGLEPPFIPEELTAEHNAVLERAASGGQVSFATRRIRKDGALLDVRINASALLDEAGQLTGWVGICHQTRDEEAVRHYMAERARVVRRLGDVVADMNAQLDLEAVLDRIAASLRELTRADAGGFVIIEGDRLRLVSLDGLPEDLRGRTADLASSTVGELMRSGKTVLMATGESGRFDDLIWSALPGLHTITLSLSHVAGRPFGALYALYSGHKVGHIDLELLELLAGHASVALSNVTAFAEVVRQRAHQRAVIDGSADGIAVLDAAGLVRQWNPAAHRLTGVSQEDATGKPPPFPLPEPGAKLTHRLPSGRWIDLLCTGLADREEQVLDFRDITAAKELEEAKDLFLATTSHELRTPITVVQGFASTLASRWDKLPDADRRSAVQTIAERAGSLAKLVEQLLLGSRAGADQLRVSNGQFDLGDVLRGAATAFRSLAGQHTLEADVPEDLPLAYGDAMATDIIVGQLLENAFKYSPQGGTVTVAARRAGDRIEVTVADEGIGIPPADLERVFERFVQGETGDRRRFGGIGLGLYIVRQLARAQGAEVAAEGRRSGGTLMRLRLRLTAPPGAEVGTAPAHTFPAYPSSDSTVAESPSSESPSSESPSSDSTIPDSPISDNAVSGSSVSESPVSDSTDSESSVSDIAVSDRAVSGGTAGGKGVANGTSDHAEVEFPRSEPVGTDSVSAKPAGGGTDVDGLRLPRPRPASDPPRDD
ncbi:MAG TPA: PAS domain S-box protein [Streptosporangiaceae bacterium]|nr:PAS domain S-box protein [Streptosporangiaceae bacterium]